MVNLAHRCLLEILKTQRCDMEHPVIADQVFDAEMNRAINQRLINGLKTRIKKCKIKINKISCLKLVDLNIKPTNKIANIIAYELFDVFHWNTVKTKEHASWKEYFHGLYDLIISDYDNDHTGNIILAREVVKYHDVLVVPESLDYNDKMYPVVSSIHDLFCQIKHEQVKISINLQPIKSVIRENQRVITSIQHDIIDFQKEKFKLENENNLYCEILRWSTK